MCSVGSCDGRPIRLALALGTAARSLSFSPSLSLSLFLFIFLPNNVNKILARLEQGRVGAQLSVRAV